MKLDWRTVAVALCAILALGGGAASARADFSDPLAVFTAPEEVPPGTGFEGPCGLAVDAKGAFYVSDYYHRTVDVFNASRFFLAQLGDLNPLDGACGLAVDSGGRLYLNLYHREVIRRVPSFFPVGPGTAYGPPFTIDASHPTGVAVDPATNYAYVNRRTEIVVYDPSGDRVQFEGSPYSVGAHSIGDGYGLAISAFPGTQGDIYVPDALSDTVKVFDSSTDKENPVQVIAPPGGFHSLRDAAIAVDGVSGEVYVTDHLQEGVAERPEAMIHVFSASGSYEGHLKYNVIDARPPGLAIDNSDPTLGTQGRVYVTSGNSEGAGIYIYPPDAATNAPPLCAPGGSCPGEGPGAGSVQAGGGPIAATAAARPGVADSPSEPTASTSEVAQKGLLRVAVSGRFAPQRLPRKGAAPISVTVGGRIGTTDQSPPPQLQRLQIQINRHGRLEHTGLPTCPYDRIHTASSQRALSACRSALVGEGSFEAEITLAGQEPYPTKGKLLVFNGKRGGRPVLFGQIYSPRPFATSFVIVFEIRETRGGTWGTELTAELPRAMGTWGNLTAIEMRLSRRYRYQGERRSYLSAGCPAPQGFGQVAFPLARASFGFEGGRTLSSVLNRSCRVG